MQLNQRALLFLQKSLQLEGQDSYATSPETEDIRGKVASLVANGGHFNVLSTNPPKSGHPRITERIRVRAAGVRDLWNLNALLSWLTVVEAPQHATRSVVNLLRCNWTTLMSWLAYLLDTRDDLCDDLSACVQFLLHIFRFKTQLSDVLVRTDQPHRWTMALWLDLGIEVDSNIPDTALGRYIPIMRSLNTAMRLLSTSVDSTSSDDYDAESVSKCLAAVEHVSHRVHRRALKSVAHIITVAYSAHGTPEFESSLSSALDVIDAQLQQANRLFTGMDVTQVSVRDVNLILNVIGLLSGLEPHPSVDAVICTVVDLLVSFWEWDQRSIGWGIYSVVEHLVKSLLESRIPEEKRAAFHTNLLTVATWTIHFPIAARFHREGTSEWIAKLAGDDKHGALWARVHAEMTKRCDLVEKLYRPRCDNYRCPKLIPPDEMRAKCCQCYEVYYCSQACQRQHWIVHRLFCTFIAKRHNRPSGHYGKTGPEIHIAADGGYVKRKGAFFVAQLVQDSLRVQGEEILSAIETAMEERPDGNDIRDFALFFRFDGNVRPKFTIQAFPAEDSDPDITLADPHNLRILVGARLPNTGRGEDHKPLIEITIMSLWELSDMVEHFRTCKDHAACVSRAQGRPPRCDKLEILGGQCDECIGDFGVDEDPWNAPTKEERKWGTY
ncbi:hypothetical protein EV122DRAFT_203831 [Schizophyllum commune]